MAATTIPCEADTNYKNAIKALASARRVTMAQLVRDALDKVHGDELERFTIFFADSETSKPRNETQTQQERSS